MSESLVIRYLVIGVAVFTLTMPGCSARQANSQISRVQKHLGFPWDEAKVTIYQRASVRLPVADGFFQIQLGDITSGRVFVTVHGRDHELVTDTTLMRQGDTLSLSLGGRDYVLCLSKLVNLIIGHDFGVFSLMPSRVWQAKNSVPDRLDFPWEKARMTIHQRASKKLRGEDGFLRVQLGDITAGEVPVTIFGPNNEVVVDTTAMQQGDTLPVPLARRGYVLRLDRLVNLPLGDDFGVF